MNRETKGHRHTREPREKGRERQIGWTVDAIVGGQRVKGGRDRGALARGGVANAVLSNRATAL